MKKRFKRRNSKMRNLKRALSLALASIMLLGMMVTGAGAASTSQAGTSVNLEMPVKLPGSTSEPFKSLQMMTAISARVTTFSGPRGSYHAPEGPGLLHRRGPAPGRLENRGHRPAPASR